MQALRKKKPQMDRAQNKIDNSEFRDRLCVWMNLIYRKASQINEQMAYLVHDAGKTG